MRAFVGLPLPPLEPIVLLTEELRACGADLKVVDPRQVHLTLKFLGEIPEAQAAPILERLRAAGFPTHYPVVLRDVGAFPDWKKMNVIWVGLEDSSGSLGRSFALSEKAFAELGFPPEARPFSPHVTLARKRSDQGREQVRQVLTAHRNERFGEATISGPILYRSTLTPEGPRYEALGSVIA